MDCWVVVNINSSLATVGQGGHIVTFFARPFARFTARANGVPAPGPLLPPCELPVAGGAELGLLPPPTVIDTVHTGPPLHLTFIPPLTLLACHHFLFSEVSAEEAAATTAIWSVSQYLPM